MDVFFFGATPANIGGGNFQGRHICHHNSPGRRVTQCTGSRSKVCLIFVAQNCIGLVYGITQRTSGALYDHDMRQPE